MVVRKSLGRTQWLIARTLRVALAFLAAATGEACRMHDDAPLGGFGVDSTAFNVPVESIRGRLLQSGGGFAVPTHVLATDSLVLVADVRSDSLFQVFDRKSRRRVLRAGHAGPNAAVFGGIWSLTRVATDPNSVWVFDIGRQRISVLRVRVADGRLSIETAPYLDLVRQKLSGPIWVRDSTFFSPGVFSGGRWAEIRPPNGTVGIVGPSPQDSTAGSEALRQMLYAGTPIAGLYDAGQNRRLALALRYTDRLELYDSSGRPLRISRGPFRFGPTAQHVKISSGEMRPRWTARTRLAYIAVTAGECGIVALFSGRQLGSAGRRAAQGRSLHVFDWSGELRRVFFLNADAINLSLAPDGQTLYTVSATPPQLREYQLGSLCA